MKKCMIVTALAAVAMLTSCGGGPNLGAKIDKQGFDAHIAEFKEAPKITSIKTTGVHKASATGVNPVDEKLDFTFDQSTQPVDPLQAQVLEAIMDADAKDLDERFPDNLFEKGYFWDSGKKLLGLTAKADMNASQSGVSARQIGDFKYQFNEYGMVTYFEEFERTEGSSGGTSVFAEERVQFSVEYTFEA